MLCEKCKKKEATIFYEETVNGKSLSYSLCGDCAKKMRQSGKLNLSQSLGSGFFEGSPFGTLSDDLFGSFFGIPENARTSKKVCPLCQISFDEIRRQGKVSCPSCYDTFSAELRDTLRSLHGNAKHTGKSPSKIQTRSDEKNRLSELRNELSRAIAEENFEHAAHLRDEIRHLENQEEGGKY